MWRSIRVQTTGSFTYSKRCIYSPSSITTIPGESSLQTERAKEEEKRKGKEGEEEKKKEERRKGVEAALGR